MDRFRHSIRYSDGDYKRAFSGSDVVVLSECPLSNALQHLATTRKGNVGLVTFPTVLLLGCVPVMVPPRIDAPFAVRAVQRPADVAECWGSYTLTPADSSGYAREDDLTFSIGRSCQRLDLRCSRESDRTLDSVAVDRGHVRRTFWRSEQCRAV